MWGSTQCYASRMNARAKRVYEEALELPPEERDELARKLLESLHAEAPEPIESAWAPIIARRVREVLDGTAPTRDLEEALDELESRARSAAR